MNEIRLITFKSERGREDNQICFDLTVQMVSDDGGKVSALTRILKLSMKPSRSMSPWFPTGEWGRILRHHYGSFDTIQNAVNAIEQKLEFEGWHVSAVMDEFVPSV